MVLRRLGGKQINHPIYIKHLDIIFFGIDYYLIKKTKDIVASNYIYIFMSLYILLSKEGNYILKMTISMIPSKTIH